jgi:hypothetical protein
MRCFFEGCISPAVRDRIAVRLKRADLSGRLRSMANEQKTADLGTRTPTPRTATGDEPSSFLRSLQYRAHLDAGRLKARKAGKRTIIAEDDAEEWLSLLPAFQEGLNQPSPETCAVAEVRRNESAHSLPPIQESLPRDPTATADALNQNVSQCARDDEGGRDFEPMLEKNRPIAARRRAVTFQGG